MSAAVASSTEPSPELLSLFAAPEIDRFLKRVFAIYAAKNKMVAKESAHEKGFEALATANANLDCGELIVLLRNFKITPQFINAETVSAIFSKVRSGARFLDNHHSICGCMCIGSHIYIYICPFFSSALRHGITMPLCQKTRHGKRKQKTEVCSVIANSFPYCAVWPCSSSACLLVLIGIIMCISLSIVIRGKFPDHMYTRSRCWVSNFASGRLLIVNTHV